MSQQPSLQLALVLLSLCFSCGLALRHDGQAEASFLEEEASTAGDVVTLGDVIKAKLLDKEDIHAAIEIQSKVPSFFATLLKCKALPRIERTNTIYEIYDPSEYVIKSHPTSIDSSLDDSSEESFSQLTSEENRAWSADFRSLHEEILSSLNESFLEVVEDIGLTSRFAEEGADVDEAEGSSMSESSSCEEIGQRQGAKVVLSLGRLAAKQVLTHEQFVEEVGDGRITTCKQDEVFHAVKLADFVGQEEQCGQDEDLDDCLAREEDQQKSILSRASPDWAFDFNVEDVVARECTCHAGMPILKQDDLEKVVNKVQMRKSPFMMHDAAKLYCEQLGKKMGKFLRPTFHKACAPQNHGYCCTPGDKGMIHKREQMMMENTQKLVKLVQRMIDDTAKLYNKVKDVTKNAGHVDMNHKVMLYKLYIIYFHHSNIFVKRHQYCVQHPEDLGNCEDSLIFYSTMNHVSKTIKAAKSNLLGLATCMKSGVRPLAEVLASHGSLAGKGWALFVNVAVRTVRFVTTGELASRVNRMAVSLGKTVWRYRFELTIMGFIAVGIQPMMAALTATGVTATAASSWSLILEQFFRNVMIYIGCPILRSSLIMSMLLRWTMAKIILSDWFIEQCMEPLWNMIKMMTPLGKLLGMYKFTATQVGRLLKAIGARLTSSNATATVNHKKTWIEVAREFHMSPIADLMYGFVSIWVAGIWRTIASAVCVALKVGNSVVSGAEAVIDVTANKAGSWWNVVSAAATGALKYVTGDKLWEVPLNMALEDEAAAAVSSGVPTKAIQAAHLALSKIDWLSSTATHHALDTVIWALETVGESAVVTYCLSGIFGFLFRDYYKPAISGELNDAALAELTYEDTLAVTAHHQRVNFNEMSCLGKKLQESCIFLNNGGLESEELTDGFCCYSRCQAAETDCPVISSEEERAQSEFDPTKVSVKSLARQSKYLYGFVDMARNAYGNMCGTGTPV
eukprot:CAMPEP_0178384412 /NCGR_PEP_ID=MMETSP0689_2-20121128/7501_1 /TAXON_ID=160604 /ORGANISM="Amphidinium massartii, Strain CS-259" /LENGTH=964 /DNA_ID=CAMNT_0020004657 /DNA_START=1 /DNA_END=2895 /DNA_ORIENTATION=-